MHGWKGEGGMVRQPVFCRRKNRIIKILVMKFIPLIWFVSGITNAARPGFRKPPGFVSNSGGFFFSRYTSSKLPDFLSSGNICNGNFESF